MKDDGDYAPRSPDLSAYDSSDTVTAFDQKYRGSVSHIQALPPPPPPPPLLPLLPPQPPLQLAPHTAQHPQPYRPPALAKSPGTVPMPSRFGKMKLEAEDPDWSPQRQAPQHAMEDQQHDPQASNGLRSHSELAPGVAEGIEVRTKFPAARIKRIMQADEDVGKVAQVTPHVVAKALELFMISLVTKAANEAKSRSSKRVTAVHLKQAVLKEEHFDFLNEIVNKVSDATATAPAAAPEARAGSPDDAAAAAGAAAAAAAAAAATAAAPAAEIKKRRSGRKKQRKDSDDL